MSFLDMFHLVMGWNCSAHVSFRNGLELRRPCFVKFVSQWAGIAPPMFHFAIVLVARLDLFHLQSCWCSTGLLFICLMSCWWLDSIYSIFSPGVGARREFRALLILLWLGFSELFVFRCGLDVRAHVSWWWLDSIFIRL